MNSERTCGLSCPRHLETCGSKRPGHRLHFHGRARDRTLCIYEAESIVRSSGGFDPNCHIAPVIVIRELVRGF